jgi:hypothetical protein
MLKSVVVLLFLSTASAFATPSQDCNILVWILNGGSCPSQPTQPTQNPGTTSMPESSAIPEFLLGVGAVGLIAWRVRKQSAKNLQTT